MYIFSMKIKKIILKTSALLAPLFLAGCGSTAPVADSTITAVQQEEIPSPPKKEPEIKDEYQKSVGNLTVSKDTFEADKAEIIRTINSLKTIMSDFDYQSWLLYVDNESKAYWSKPANLKKAQNKLPVKGLQLKNLQDYFKYVFVPSRAGRDITTIRYESENYVKAVQITSTETQDSDEKYTVFYYFNKIDGHWQLHLPEIEG